MQRVRLTILVENRSARAAVGSEHGWSVLIEAGDRQVLFDTGASDLVLRNARALGRDLSGVGAVAISHGHCDHTGGLAAVLDAVGPRAGVFVHPAALEPKFAVRPGQPAREIGMAGVPAADRLRAATGPQEIIPGVRWLGQVPRSTRYEDTGGPFFLDPEGRTADPLEDDTSLLVSTPSGPVLISGCAHAGIVNTVRHAADLAGGKHFAAVLGGMHLLSASADRIARTISDLGEFEFDAIGPAHCTGQSAERAFRKAYGQRCREYRAGTVVEF
jgi:7,8-dihydropterin-6-yl-methyl-4-(beta-D-ribofuranosyl)aminobenzene 5'-phosphate synthase